MLIPNRLSAVLITLLLAACASTEQDPTLGWSVDKIYQEAREELSNLQFEKAVKLYEKLEGRAAGTTLAQQAQLEKAYAYYRNKDTALAISTLDRYIKIYPASPAVDYALYLKGIVNFNEDTGFLEVMTRQDMADRDQKASKESFDAFKELVSRFPDSKYSEDARLRMKYMVNILARSEVNVARYYYRRGAYVAAVNRAQTVLQDYQGTSAVEDALRVLMDCYQQLGLTQLRDDTRRVLLTNYPQANLAPPPPKAWWKFW